MHCGLSAYVSPKPLADARVLQSMVQLAGMPAVAGWPLSGCLRGTAHAERGAGGTGSAGLACMWGLTAQLTSPRAPQQKLRRNTALPYKCIG